MKQTNLMDYAYSVISKLTPAEVEACQKQDQSALCIFDETDNGRRITFNVCYDKKSQYGALTSNGIVFPGVNKDGNLVVTTLIPAQCKPEDYLYDYYAVALNNLAIVENKVVEALKDRVSSREAFATTITRLDGESVEMDEMDE